MNKSDGEEIQLERYYRLRNVVDMTEAHHRVLLDSIIACDVDRDGDGGDIIDRTHEVTAEIIKLIPDYKKIKNSGLWETRALCPLCGRSSASTNEGFKLTEGMRRHLTGDSLKGERCPVIEAAYLLAFWPR